MLLKEIRSLLYKEFLVEWRLRYAINGMLLYVVSTIFVCYMSFKLKTGDLSPTTWNALLWIVLLFAAVNSISKSFVQEKEGRTFFYYTLASPQAIILSKIIYNATLMVVIGVLALGFYTVVMGNPVQDMPLFCLNLVVASTGFSATLTLVAGIAGKAGNNAALMPVLGFPIILPMLLMVIKLSKNAMDGLQWSVSQDELIVILALHVIVTALSYILFPYLWRS